jgi:hypothetical protein
MPKVTGPLFSLEAVGKLKDTITYQRRPGGAAVVFQPDPRQPRTAAQVAQRASMASAVSFWQSMEAGLKQHYRNAASGTGMSGYNRYVRKFMNTAARPWVIGTTQIGQSLVG